MLGLLLAVRPAHADTFTVNNASFDTDDGVCEPLGVPEDCTLREAINDANAAGGADTIGFDIPGGGVKTIEPNPSGLPPITGRVTINGYTQPGASPNTLAQGNNAALLIQLDGSNSMSDQAGLFIDDNASNTVIRGLIINRFGASGIIIDGATGVKIEGNFIGTDTTGTQDLGNEVNGVSLNSPNNVVGGAVPGARNVISGNNENGVVISTNLAKENKVQGNYIGTTKSGTSLLGNALDGVLVFTSDNIIGGNTSSAANTIAFNGQDGVTVCCTGATGNRVLRNSIFSNGALGVDLNSDGLTPNDTKDPDTGANGLQNFPNLSSAKNSGGQTTIKGTLNSKPNKNFVLRFFSNPPAGAAEGKRCIGQKSVSTNQNGNTGTFTFKPANKVGVGQSITAAATDPNGNTSEFSAPRPVTSPQ